MHKRFDNYCQLFAYILKCFNDYVKQNRMPIGAIVCTKVWSKKKFPRVCRYYVNSFSFCEKSLKSVKSSHSELSKMVRQAHAVQKIPPGSMIEQKNVF